MNIILICHTIGSIGGKKPVGMMGPGVNNPNAVQKGMQDPIGALQSLACQGAGNNANMGMQGPGQNQQQMGQQMGPGGNIASNCKYIIIIQGCMDSDLYRA